MPDGCKRYVKEMSRRLHCSKKAKRRLLDQFETYRTTTQDTDSDCTYEQMVTNYGPPEDMAQELMREVTVKERSVFGRSILIKTFFAIALVVVFIIGTLFIWFFKDKPISSSGTTYIISETLPDFSETEVTP